MSDGALGASISRGLAWINASPPRAALVLVPVLVYVFGLGIWSYFWSGEAIREFVGNGLPADEGVLWASIFVGLTLPAVIFTVFVLLFAATRRWWSLVLMAISFAPIIFAVSVNPSGILGKHRRSRSLEALTQIIGDANVAEVIETALAAGKWVAAIIAFVSIVWVFRLTARRRFGDASTRHRSSQSERVERRDELKRRLFIWGYPCAVLVGIPLIALAGAANAS